MPETPATGGPALGVVGRGRLGAALLAACRADGTAVSLTASRGGGWQADAVPEVIVDASAPEAHDVVLDYCASHRVPLVACVSNLTDAQWKSLAELATVVPVVRATNLSFAHYLQLRIAEFTAALTRGPLGAALRPPSGSGTRPTRHTGRAPPPWSWPRPGPGRAAGRSPTSPTNVPDFRSANTS